MVIHNEIYGEINPIEKKIEVLQDFCILKKNVVKQREAVFNILAACNSEVQMDQKIHNLLHGKESLKEFINRHNMSFLR